MLPRIEKETETETVTFLETPATNYILRLHIHRHTAEEDMMTDIETPTEESVAGSEGIIVNIIHRLHSPQILATTNLTLGRTQETHGIHEIGGVQG